MAVIAIFLPAVGDILNSNEARSHDENYIFILCACEEKLKEIMYGLMYVLIK